MLRKKIPNICSKSTVDEKVVYIFSCSSTKGTAARPMPAPLLENLPSEDFSSYAQPKEELDLQWNRPLPN
jgi:hypothetical protein